MKARELIEALRGMDPETEVVIQKPHGDGWFSHIDFDIQTEDHPTGRAVLHAIGRSKDYEERSFGDAGRIRAVSETRQSRFDS